MTDKTRKDIYVLLRTAFTQAAKWKDVEVNLMLNVMRPKYKSKKEESWNAEDTAVSLALCEDEQLALIK